MDTAAMEVLVDGLTPEETKELARICLAALPIDLMTDVIEGYVGSEDD